MAVENRDKRFLRRRLRQSRQRSPIKVRGGFLAGKAQVARKRVSASQRRWNSRTLKLVGCILLSEGRQTRVSQIRDRPQQRAAARREWPKDDLERSRQRLSSAVACPTR